MKKPKRNRVTVDVKEFTTSRGGTTPMRKIRPIVVTKSLFKSKPPKE